MVNPFVSTPPGAQLNQRRDSDIPIHSATTTYHAAFDHEQSVLTISLDISKATQYTTTGLKTCFAGSQPQEVFRLVVVLLFDLH